MRRPSRAAGIVLLVFATTAGWAPCSGNETSCQIEPPVITLAEFRHTFDLIDGGVDSGAELECTSYLRYTRAADPVFQVECRGGGYGISAFTPTVVDPRRADPGTGRYPAKIVIHWFGDRHSYGVPDGGAPRSFDAPGEIVLTVASRIGGATAVTLGESRPPEEENKITPIVTDDFRVEGSFEIILGAMPSPMSDAGRTKPIAFAGPPAPLRTSFARTTPDYVAKTVCYRD